VILRLIAAPGLEDLNKLILEVEQNFVKYGLFETKLLKQGTTASTPAAASRATPSSSKSLFR
jgi:hypothetical protein